VLGIYYIFIFIYLYIRKKLALTSPTGGGRSVGIVRSRTKATEFFLYTYIWELRISNLVKIRPIAGELFHAGMKMYSET